MLYHVSNVRVQKESQGIGLDTTCDLNLYDNIKRS